MHTVVDLNKHIHGRGILPHQTYISNQAAIERHDVGAIPTLHHDGQLHDLLLVCPPQLPNWNPLWKDDGDNRLNSTGPEQPNKSTTHLSGTAITCTSQSNEQCKGMLRGYLEDKGSTVKRVLHLRYKTTQHDLTVNVYSSVPTKHPPPFFSP